MSSHPPTPAQGAGATEVRRLFITGRVQGVWFRGSMVAQANELGITGWVRNRRDGGVEAVVCGSAEQVAAIINWARHGPPGAQVEHVAVELAQGEFAAFTQESNA